MNKFCYVRYEISDTNDVKVTDFPDFRVVDCSFKKRLGFFGKRRVRKFTDGFCTLDEKKLSEDLFVIRPKELFRKHILLAVREFSRIYNIPLFNKEIVVAFRHDYEILKQLSEAFGMVYVIAPKTDCDLYNVFYTEKCPDKHFDFEIFDTDCGVCADHIFNLSDLSHAGEINDIITAYCELDILPDFAKNSVICQYNLPFSITGFVR